MRNCKSQYATTVDKSWCVYTCTKSYLKNHLTKHRHVCTHSNAYFLLIPNMAIIYDIFAFFENVKEQLM